MTEITEGYRGRFAPSPSGRLHFGSLLTAVGSYLDARSQGGKWLLRIEDLDTPRVQADATTAILRTLEKHHLFWDEAVSYQSQRLNLYKDILEQWSNQQLTFPCNCSRKRLKSLPDYDGHCLQHPPQQPPYSVRLRRAAIANQNKTQLDVFEGDITTEQLACDDIILSRRDGIFAYNFAVVVDDHFQGINHVIRGRDLISMSRIQGQLHELLGGPAPQVGHLPLVVDAQGRKFSKQNLAPPLQDNQASENLMLAMRLLGLQPPSDALCTSPSDILSWATSQWTRKSRIATVCLPSATVDC